MFYTFNISLRCISHAETYVCVRDLHNPGFITHWLVVSGSWPWACSYLSASSGSSSIKWTVLATSYCLAHSKYWTKCKALNLSIIVSRICYSFLIIIFSFFLLITELLSFSWMPGCPACPHSQLGVNMCLISWAGRVCAASLTGRDLPSWLSSLRLDPRSTSCDHLTKPTHDTQGWGAWERDRTGTLRPCTFCLPGSLTYAGTSVFEKINFCIVQVIIASVEVANQYNN